ncbi:MAG: hypothetical protein LUH50_17015 [Bacteroides intestinalis]|nr:hypothetical protein [Bacteroides intestinalis]
MGKEYFTEDELIEKFQNGEIGYLDYVTSYSEEWDREFAEFLEERGLKAGDDSAQEFLKYKDELMEEGYENGNCRFDKK